MCDAGTMRCGECVVLQRGNLVCGKEGLCGGVIDGGLRERVGHRVHPPPRTRRVISCITMTVFIHVTVYIHFYTTISISISIINMVSSGVIGRLFAGLCG